jgi:hypothetical protein
MRYFKISQHRALGYQLFTNDMIICLDYSQDNKLIQEFIRDCVSIAN